MKLTHWLQERNDNRRYNNDIITRLTRYVLPYYGDKEITTWARNEYQRGWLDSLEEQGLSVSTIEICRNAANMYLRFHAEESDGEIQYSSIRLTLPTLTKKRKYKIEVARKEAMRKADVVRMEGQYITDIDIDLILGNCEGYMRALIWVSYHYGLRLAECLACLGDDYKNDYLLVSEQASSKYENKYLKGVLARKVPHFELSDIKKKATFQILKTIKEKRVNPTTVSRDFKKLMKDLHMNYRFHDLRGTWITNLSLNDINSELIRQAAGHQDMATTQRYLRDPHVCEHGSKVFGG
jgi:integrase